MNGFVGAMVGGFELAGRLVMGVRAVVKAAVGERAAEPSGAVSRSAPVWRRWRTVPPPHPCLLCAAALSVLPIRLLIVGTPPKASGRQASVGEIANATLRLLRWHVPAATAERVCRAAQKPPALADVKWIPQRLLVYKKFRRNSPRD